jgi:formylglycine-generating enzyme required for sulfatase activity
VGSFAPNGYGIHDMAGNLWQWCWDWFAAYGSGNDPRGPTSGSVRVVRGGGWYGSVFESRTAGCYDFAPAQLNGDSYGFRAVLSPGQ